MRTQNKNMFLKHYLTIGLKQNFTRLRSQPPAKALALYKIGVGTQKEHPANDVNPALN